MTRGVVISCACKVWGVDAVTLLRLVSENVLTWEDLWGAVVYEVAGARAALAEKPVKSNLESVAAFPVDDMPEAPQ